MNNEALIQRDPNSVRVPRSLFFCLFYIAIVFLDKVRLSPYVSYFVFIVWLVSVFFENNKTLLLFRKKRYACFLIFLVYYLFAHIVGGGIILGFHNVLAMAATVSPILMFDIYKDSNYKTHKIVVIFFLIIFLINSICLYKVAISSPLGLRLVNLAENDEFYLKDGFGQVYCLALFVPFLFYVLKHLDRKDFHSRLLFCPLVLSLLFFSLVVVRSLFTTAVVIMLLGITFTFFYDGKKWLLKSVITIFVILFLFIFLFELLFEFVGGFDVPGFHIILEKMNEVKSILISNGEDASDFGIRINLALSSFKTFTEHPIIGLTSCGGEVDDLIDNGLGNHSEWVDFLALYGLFSVFMFAFIIKSIQEQKKIVHFHVIYILYLILGFLNPLFYFSQNCIAFFFVPISYLFLNESTAS